MTNLSKCPECGGEADNGHDRCLPPNVYTCTKCMTPDKVEEKTQNEEWGAWKFVSEMLDTPDENGIYHTSKCYEQIHDFVVEQKQKAVTQHHQDLMDELNSDLVPINDTKRTKAEEIVKNWLKNEKKRNYIAGPFDSMTLDGGSFDFEELVKALTQHHQETMSEVVERIEKAKYPKDSTQGCNCNGYNNALTEAQTIIKSLSK